MRLQVGNSVRFTKSEWETFKQRDTAVVEVMFRPDGSRPVDGVAICGYVIERDNTGDIVVKHRYVDVLAEGGDVTVTAREVIEFSGPLSDLPHRLRWAAYV